jgi:hypothetical protein
MAAPPALRRVEALIDAGLSLARKAPTGRLAFAQLARVIEPEWIPGCLQAQLAPELARAAAAAAEPLSGKAVEKLLRNAWDGKPTDELDDLDLVSPVASTATSQVHRGVLDGKPVAVKVLRPGIRPGIRQDLALVDALAGPMGAAFPALDPKALIREVRERVMEDLDLEHEADAQRRFGRALRGHPTFVVPAVHTRLAHEDVLVSEWIDGIPLADAADVDTAAAALITFALGGARSAGIIHADIDPLDVRVLDDGRLAILDYGSTAASEPERAAVAADAADAIAGDDGPGFGAALEKLGALPASDGPDALALARVAGGELLGPGPSLLDSAAVIAARDRGLAEPEALAALLGAGSLESSELWPARGAAQAFAAVARVGATGDWLAIARAALRDGWAAA